MVNFQKINKQKINWCPNCDNPMDYKDKKCSNCGYIIPNSKNKQIKKKYKSLNTFNPLKGT